MTINIVLFEPEIPPNTGNIARSCAATGSTLHLIKPLGFSIDDKQVKRAGLDYWDLLDLHVYENLDELFVKYPQGKFYFATTKAKKYYHNIRFQEGDFLVFGKETAGLPPEVLNNNMETCIKIPMIPVEGARSLNLSNSVNIILFEALRQLGFESFI